MAIKMAVFKLWEFTMTYSIFSLGFCFTTHPFDFINQCMFKSVTLIEVIKCFDKKYTVHIGPTLLNIRRVSVLPVFSDNSELITRIVFKSISLRHIMRKKTWHVFRELTKLWDTHRLWLIISCWQIRNMRKFHEEEFNPTKWSETVYIKNYPIKKPISRTPVRMLLLLLLMAISIRLCVDLRALNQELNIPLIH